MVNRLFKGAGPAGASPYTPAPDGWDVRMAEREWIQGHICFLERHEITSTLIAGLEAHWNGVRGTRTMPRREEIDPIELVPWLPYVSMMELHYDPFRVRYRVVGTEVARIIREDFSNRWLDETGWDEPAIALSASPNSARRHTASRP